MNKTEKNQVIDEVVELIESSSAIYLTDYRGINVADISNLRREFRKEGLTYKVVKNTFFQKAMAKVGGYEKFEPYLEGMTGFVFATDNPTAPAKIIKKFHDDKSKLPLKACIIEGEFFDGSQLDTVAALPSKQEIVAGILGSLNAPASGIVGALNAVMRDLVSVIDEIAKQKAA